MVEKIRRHFAIILLFCAILFFYSPFLLSIFESNAKIPLPADTIVGLYSPYRDFYADSYPNGMPYKNFLITDPVRQTYVWREQVIDIWKKLQIPSWNPYEMTGKPLIGNFQSAAFYPLNLLLWLTPFTHMWALLIFLQSIMGGIFMYFYLKNLKLNTYPASLGAISFVFSSFSISWLEWGTVVQTAIWLPIILFSIDKIFEGHQKTHLKYFSRIKRSTFWMILFVFFASFSFFGGHLQIFFYLYILAILYFILRLIQNKRKISFAGKFILANIFFILITAIQWYPTLRFIFLSARQLDQNFREIVGWFIPFKHLIQFLVPDFFGNPATLNYWGTWNYGELTGYIGIIPLTFVLFAYFKRNSTILFFSFAIFISLLLALPTGISNIPYILNIPFLSSAQPTRMLFIITFSLSVLSAFGASYFFNLEKFNYKKILPLLIPLMLFIVLWILMLTNSTILFEKAQDLAVARRNLIFPTIIFITAIILIPLTVIIKKKYLKEVIVILILIASIFDLLRFAQKFTPFVASSYVFPNTATIEFLKKDKSIYRVAVMDRRIMTPNFFTHYKIQTIEGYDPLYLRSYGEYIVALERNKADLMQPFGFNRIITPHNYNSELFNFLNTKYILSFEELLDPQFAKVFEEGQTKVYENKKAYPRVFFVEKVQQSANILSDLFKFDLHTTAIISKDKKLMTPVSVGTATVNLYTENRIAINTSNEGDGFLVLSDAYYPTWNVYVDGIEGKIYKTNYAFRGVFVPRGKHTILFKDSLF